MNFNPGVLFPVTAIKFYKDLQKEIKKQLGGHSWKNPTLLYINKHKPCFEQLTRKNSTNLFLSFFNGFQ